MNSGNKYQLTRNRLIIQLFILFGILGVAFIFSIAFGSVNIPPLEVLKALLNIQPIDERAKEIIMNIRLPRVLLAILVGAGLSVNGAVFQALLKNPLAEPYILGISSGGAFGGLLSVTLGLGMIWMHLFSLSGALLVVAIVFFVSRRFGEIDNNYLILSGVMISAFLSSLIFLMISFSDQTFRMAIYWLLGNLSLADYNMLIVLTPFLLLTMLPAVLFSHSYNLLSIDDDNAKQFGINTKVVKNLSYFTVSLLTSIIVARVGVIGFVGFLIPHLCRLIFGNDNKILIPASAITGSIFLVIADFISRYLFAPLELPIGAVTALIGSPIFIIMLRKRLRSAF